MTSVVIISADRTAGSGYAHNLGDALLSDALAEALESKGLSTTIVDFGGNRCVPTEPRRRLSGIAALWRCIRRADAVVIGGGTLLQDDAGAGFGGLPRLVAAASWCARLAGRPAFFYGVGCDPVDRWVARALLKAAVWRRTVWARDRPSLERVRALGCSDVRLGADAALLSLSKVAGTVGEEGCGAAIALAPREASRLDSEILMGIRDGVSPLSFVQMDQGDGAGDASALPSTVRSEFETVTERLSWRQAVEHYAGAEVVAASRMHALYIGMMLGKPLLAVSDRPKVHSFADEFGVARVDSLRADSLAVACIADRESVDSAVSRAEGSLSELVERLDP